MKQSSYDVVVIGGGHAGCEAAHAVARMGRSVGLVTFSRDDLGALSCNPAVGGVGKGHLVREIDAMGGIMGEVADGAGLHFRLLNRSKGPAVHGPRVQVGRALYRKGLRDVVDGTRVITVIEDEVIDLEVRAEQVVGIRLGRGGAIGAGAVVIATGTFLGGTLHVGMEARSGGRASGRGSSLLAARLRNRGLVAGCLKTGTPPRIDGTTIDWDRVSWQAGDDDPVFLSFATESVPRDQLACGITHTNPRTHDLVGRNTHRSALHGGRLKGTGPRYCPSIEDKITRFAGQASHQVFLEPECIETTTVYPNGISTSLPADVQEQFVHTIAGLETCRITALGYAVEYDFVDPRRLDHSLQVKDLRGLFLAGQINGTTGYEEAAAQGLMAGLNAALLVEGRARFVLDRRASYIGVLIDDLVTRGVTEPYRMFTSRAEFRLSLRIDNADRRLSPTAMELGCLSDQQSARFEKRMRQVDDCRSVLTRSAPRPGGGAGPAAQASLYELLGRSDTTIEEIVRMEPQLSSVPLRTLERLRAESLYRPYEERQRHEAARLDRDDAISIPAGLDYSRITGLSAEVVERLRRVQPASLGHAMRMEGMTPAAGVVLLAAIRRHSQPHRRTVEVG